MVPYTVQTLADHWQCSGQHIRDLINSGTLKAFRVGRLIRIPQQNVREFEQCESSNIEESGPCRSEQETTGEDSQPDSMPQGKIVSLPSGRKTTLRSV
ncbi:MAG: helix-turn-helix domain-containing protein [Proteobacteria bacterium]|nr:helix-turn-helix domain-containing protein [Pseudomonadota bacterium]